MRELNSEDDFIQNMIFGALSDETLKNHKIRKSPDLFNRESNHARNYRVAAFFAKSDHK